MSEQTPTSTPATRFVFPRWTNYLLLILAIGGAGGALYVPVLAQLGASPRTLAVGYAPKQPVPFSHAQHAGQLGIDCRYCHIGVDKGPHSTHPADADLHELSRERQDAGDRRRRPAR